MLVVTLFMTVNSRIKIFFTILVNCIDLATEDVERFYLSPFHSLVSLENLVLDHFIILLVIFFFYLAA